MRGNENEGRKEEAVHPVLKSRRLRPEDCVLHCIADLSDNQIARLRRQVYIRYQRAAGTWVRMAAALGGLQRVAHLMLLRTAIQGAH